MIPFDGGSESFNFGFGFGLICNRVDEVAATTSGVAIGRPPVPRFEIDWLVIPLSGGDANPRGRIFALDGDMAWYTGYDGRNRAKLRIAELSLSLAAVTADDARGWFWKLSLFSISFRFSSMAAS